MLKQAKKALSDVHYRSSTSRAGHGPSRTGHKCGGAWHPRPVEEPNGRHDERQGGGCGGRCGGRWRSPAANVANDRAEGATEGAMASAAEGKAGRSGGWLAVEGGCSGGVWWRAAAVVEGGMKTSARRRESVGA
jgi:hypothetical protein